MMVPPPLRKSFAPQDIPERLWRELPIEMLYRPQAITVNAEDQMVTLPSLVDLLLHYSNYPLPVVMAGTEDRTTDPHKHAIPMSRQLPDVRLRMLPGLGHMIPHFAQGAVAETVEDVLEPARVPA